MANGSDSAVERLVVHGARRMAEDGWQGADLAEVVAEAGLDDPGAVAYHFGSREGLLLEVLSRGIELLTARGRAYVEPLGPHGDESLEQVWQNYVRPLAGLLLDPFGRDLLRVSGQLCTRSGPGRALTAGPSVGTALAGRWRRIESLLAERVGEPAARDRLGWVVVLLDAALGARATELVGWVRDSPVGTDDAASEQDLDELARLRGRPAHAEFVEWLQRAMLVVLTT